MTRTFRGSVSDPKRTTTDSRSQLKNTTVSNLDSPSLRRKRVRSKNTGRLEFVDHDHEFVESASMRGVRPKREGVGVGLPPPPGVKVSRVSEETDKPTGNLPDTGRYACRGRIFASRVRDRHRECVWANSRREGDFDQSARRGCRALKRKRNKRKRQVIRHTKDKSPLKAGRETHDYYRS